MTASTSENALLARRLVATRQQLDDLWEATKLSAQREAITEQMSDLDKQIMRLIAANIDGRSASYRQAAAALGDANRVLRRALSDSQEFIGAMAAVARAVELLTNVK